MCQPRAAAGATCTLLAVTDRGGAVPARQGRRVCTPSLSLAGDPCQLLSCCCYPSPAQVRYPVRPVAEGGRVRDSWRCAGARALRAAPAVPAPCRAVAGQPPDSPCTAAALGGGRAGQLARREGTSNWAAGAPAGLPARPQELADICSANPLCKGFVYLPQGLDFKSAVGSHLSRRRRCCHIACSCSHCRCRSRWRTGAPARSLPWDRAQGPRG